MFAPATLASTITVTPFVPFVPGFISDVYACSPYGDVAALNKLYYATADTAAELARRYNATPVLRASTSMSPISTRWNTVQIPAGSTLLPPPGTRQTDPQKIEVLMELPRFYQWALRFANGVEVNAGFLADYYRRNPEAQFPGLADRYCRAILASEGVSL